MLTNLKSSQPTRSRITPEYSWLRQEKRWRYFNEHLRDTETYDHQLIFKECWIMQARLWDSDPIFCSICQQTFDFVNCPAMHSSVRNVGGDMSLVVTLCTTWFNTRKFYVLPIEWKNMLCIVLRKKIFPEKQFTYCFSNGGGVYLFSCAVGLRTEPWNITQINLELKGPDWRRTCVCVCSVYVCVM
jgi:hypothetical protein